MCWISKHLNLKVTTKDILVYKIVQLDNNNIMSLYYNYHYTIDKLNPSIHFVVTERPYFWAINQGYHSYMSMPFMYKNNIYRIYRNSVIKSEYSILSNLNMRIAKCIIPKNTRYIVNKNGDVVSDTIIVKSIIDLPIQNRLLI